MNPMTWAYLAGAIVGEVAATLALRMAVTGRRRWFAIVGGGYLVAITLVSLALAGGMPLGVAYGIWVAAGVALTATASAKLFSEPFTPVMGLGTALVAGGVLLVEMGAP